MVGQNCDHWQWLALSIMQETAAKLPNSTGEQDWRMGNTLMGVSTLLDNGNK